MRLLKMKAKPNDRIPTASMADVAFLLLIFFLVTTVFPRDSGLRVVLPTSVEELEVARRNVLQIEVMPDGTLAVRRGAAAAVTSLAPADLAAIWRADVASNPGLIAAVNTHPEAPHRYMIAVLDALQLARAERISLQLLEPEN